MIAATTAQRWCCQKINLLTKKWTKSALKEKVYFLLFPTSITFLVLTVTYQPYLVFETECYKHYHIAKAHSISKHTFKVWKPKGNSFYIRPKSRKPFSLELKRPRFCHFLGLKAVWRKNYDYKSQFFLEILKAVCLSVDWVPKLIQKFFPTMKQKLVQRCETDIVADTCNAS